MAFSHLTMCDSFTYSYSLFVFADIWTKMMNYIQDVANTTGKLHLVMGPVFDYDADGVRDLDLSQSL